MTTFQIKRYISKGPTKLINVKQAAQQQPLLRPHSEEDRDAHRTKVLFSSPTLGSFRQKSACLLETPKHHNFSLRRANQLHDQQKQNKE